MPEISEIDIEEEIIDGMIAQLKEPEVSCFLCKHLNKDMISCKAFPGGVKQDIISGKFKHTKAFGGEKKKNRKPILFEEK